MAFSMTTAQYAAITSDFDRYRQVYEMFSGNTDAQYEVFCLDHLNQTIARLEDELAQRQHELRQRLDSLLDHVANGGQFLQTLFLGITGSLSGEDILSTSSYNRHDLMRNRFATPVSSPPQFPLPECTSPSGSKRNPIVVQDDDGWVQIPMKGPGETSRILRSRFSPSIPIPTSSNSNLLLPSPFQIHRTSIAKDDDDDDSYSFCSCCLQTGHLAIHCPLHECQHCRLLAPGHKASDCQYLF